MSNFSFAIVLPAMDLNVSLKGSGLPILCLHGHPGNSSCMSVFTEHLADRFFTLAPDLRGYGKSHFRGNFQMQNHLEDLIFLLDKYQIDRPLLLGWSLGGIIAIELALAHPERFQGIILIASAARPRSNHPPVSKRELLATAIAAAIDLIKPAWRWNIELFGKKSLFRYLVRQHTDTVYQYLASQGIPAYFQTSKAASLALKQAISLGYDRLEDLVNLDIPCLILAGDRDCHITCQSSQETALKLSNSTWKCYTDVAHLFPWEIPDIVLSDIDRWLINNNFNY
jgi:pimeloyl-ACP methyl ester carboxylesterase